MVCKWDWEQRHPADFYRGRNDAHKLPWTRSDDGADPSLHWSGAIVGLTLSPTSQEAALQGAGDYRVDPLLGQTYGNVALVQWQDNVSNINLIFPQSRTTTAGGSFNLPTTPGGTGSVVFRTNYGIIGTVPVVATVNTVTSPVWTSLPGSVYASFSYGT